MVKILILINLFFSILCDEEFKTLDCLFPTCLTLYNGDNLLFCSKGIYTYNSNFEEEKLFYKFENETKNIKDANFVTISQYPNNDYVILITKDKFYFISSEGRVLFSKDLIIDNKGAYYTLVPYKYNNNYYFVVGFINSSSLLNLIYYKVDTLNQEIELIVNSIPNVKTMKGGIGTNFINGFNCQIMNSYIYNDILTCFFEDYYPGEIGAFSYYINTTIEIIDDSFSHIEMSEGKNVIKSVVSPDKSKALICFSCDNSNGYYLKYDINLLQFYSEPVLYTNKCGDFANNLQVYYFSRTQEYIFSCGLNVRNLFKMAKFDKDLNIIQNANLTDEIEFDFSLSCSNYYDFNMNNIVFIPEFGNYIFIIDGKKNEGTTARFYYFPDIFIPNETFISQSEPTNKITTNKITNISTTIINAVQSTIINPSTTLLNFSPSITSIISKNSNISSSIINIHSTEIKNTISFPSTTTKRISPSTITDSTKSNIRTTEALITTSLSNFKTSLINDVSSTTSFIRIPNISSKIKSTLLSTSLSNYPSLSQSISFFSNTLITSNPSLLSRKINSSYPSSSYSSSIHTQKIISTFIQKNEKNEDKNNNDVCSTEYSYKNIITNECVKQCSYNESINEICYINNLTENNINNITQNCRDLINKIEVNKKTNLVINGNNAIYQIISSEVMNDNINKNISIIDFGDCGEKIKYKYGIDYLLILQLDIFLDTSQNIIMKYEVFNPYTLEKIDLSICDEMTINTYLPYLIPEEDLDLYIKLQELGYDLYNPNDSFYHDICTPYTTSNKTDILLSDRRLDYYKNMTFCEEGCTYKNYNYTIKRVQCECNVNNEINSNIDNIKFYGNYFFSSFFQIENFSNIKILKCLKLVFSKLGQIKNIGSYIFIALILINIILFILFCKDGKNQLFIIINIVIKNKNVKMPIKKKTKKDKVKKNIPGNKNNKIILNKNITINNNYIFKGNNNNNKSNSLLNAKKSTKKINLNSISSIEKLQKKNTNNKLSSKLKIINKGNKKKSKEIKIEHKYNDMELNSLIYKHAIIYDKRTYFQYYCSLLKQKHLIFFTFLSKNDYNLFMIKLSLFIFSFSLYFTINIFFFNDSILHIIYKNDGKKELIYSLLNIFYSTVISFFITLIAKFLALSDKKILELKNYKNRKQILNKSQILIKELIVKCYIYFIISFFLLTFSWYFISAFCAVYNNSQLSLFLNTFGSFIISLIYPFGLYLLPGMFRITALRSKNKNCLYTFSIIISYL